MSTEIIKLENEELSLVSESRANEIRKVFQPMADVLESYEEDYKDIVKQFNDAEINDGYLKVVKRLRLDYAKIRTSAKKVKDSQKKEILTAGRAIDGIFNIIRWAVEGKEEHLKEIETYQEKIEEERLEKLQIERVNLIDLYIENANERNFANMENDVWDAYLTSKKNEYNDRIEAEKKAELKRIEDEKIRIKKERKEKIRLVKIEKENKLLKEKQARKDKLHKTELKKSADAEIAAKNKEQKAKDQLIKEKEEKEKVKAKNDKLESDNKKLESISRRSKEELDKLKDGRKKADNMERISKETESRKSDKVKLTELSEGFIKFDATSSMKTKEGKIIAKRIELLLSKVAKDINEQIKKIK